MSKINTTQVTDTKTETKQTVFCSINRFCNKKEQSNQNTSYNNLHAKNELDCINKIKLKVIFYY